MKSSAFSRRVGYMLLMAGVLAGCTQSQRTTQSSAAESAPDIAMATDAPSPATASDLVVLRDAMAMLPKPQAVHFELHEHRTTTGQDIPETVNELHLEVTGRLLPPALPQNPAPSLLFEHIVLSYGDPGRQGGMLTYDSAVDKPKQGNPLADIMTVVNRAEATLTFDRPGELRELDELDARWRGADMLMVPPALLTAQWMFRDIGMGELVSEAFFPPMPQSSVRAGETWKVDLPANVMLVAPLAAELTGRCMKVINDAETKQPVVEASLAGKIKPREEVFGDVPPSVRPTVEESRCEITQVIRPADHALKQESKRELVLRVTLQPPNDGAPRTMTIHQTRTLKSTRGANNRAF